MVSVCLHSWRDKVSGSIRVTRPPFFLEEFRWTIYTLFIQIQVSSSTNNPGLSL